MSLGIFSYSFASKVFEKKKNFFDNASTGTDLSKK